MKFTTIIPTLFALAAAAPANVEKRQGSYGSQTSVAPVTSAAPGGYSVTPSGYSASPSASPSESASVSVAAVQSNAPVCYCPVSYSASPSGSVSVGAQDSAIPSTSVKPASYSPSGYQPRNKRRQGSYGSQTSVGAVS